MSFKLEALDIAYYSAQDTLGRRLHPDNPISTYAGNKIPGREKTRTNIGAYKEFLGREADVLDLLSFMRSGMSQDELDIANLAAFSGGMSGLPIYVASRFPETIYSLPPSVIDASRVSQGVYVTLVSMVGEGISPYKALTPEEIYTYAGGKNKSNFNFFIGPRSSKESCPAPEGMIKKVLSTMIKKEERPIDADSDWRDLLSSVNKQAALAFGYHYWSTRFLDAHDQGELDKWLEYANRAFAQD